MGLFEKALRDVFKGDAALLRAGMALCLLVSDGVIHTDGQILLSHWVLMQLFAPLTENPFLPYLSDAVQHFPTNQAEGSEAFFKRLLLHYARVTEAGYKKSDVNALMVAEIKKYYVMPVDEMMHSLETVPNSDENIQQQLKEALNQKKGTKWQPSSITCLGLAGFGVRPLVVRSAGTAGHDTLAMAQSALTFGSNETGFGSTLQPLFSTVAPPLHPLVDMKWIRPVDPMCMLYDASLASDIDKYSTMSELFQQATISSLSQTQVSTFVAELNSNPSLVDVISVNSSNLPLLVEHNPTLASELLARIVCRKPMKPSVEETSDETCHQSSIGDSTLVDSTTMQLLNSLLTINMSLQSMEVVNHLSMHCPQPHGLPIEFLRAYISSCITYCENVKDKYLQNRLVRLLCVFVQSLLRSKVLLPGEVVLMEVQSFCVEFTKIREANGLFKLLKSLETDL